MRRGLYRSEKNGRNPAKQHIGRGYVSACNYPRIRQIPASCRRVVCTDKVFSVLNNDLIKAGFINDVRRLAKKDVRAAIKLVAEANAAAQKYAGKPILTPRHSIHAELAALAESQHRTKTATSRHIGRNRTFQPYGTNPATRRPALLFTLSNWQNGSNEMHFKV